MIRVAIADDHAIVREGLKRIISMTSDLAVTGDVASADELLTLLRTSRFDILVLDLILGTRSGLELLKQIKSELPRLPVLILSMHASSEYALRALRAGAGGYVQKESAPEELVNAIRRVVAGGTYVSSALAERLAMQLARAGTKAAHELLSDRELQVFLLLAAGKSVSEIAGELNLSVKTVSTHRARILEKTGFERNADIIRYAIEHRLH
ncbi:MAG: two component transcriptional regulator, LuxR family [Acidobacteria bacterium]|nr:two component transcriptional regulator, LuxR family [Acidobacteriota bacterium]